MGEGKSITGSGQRKQGEILGDKESSCFSFQKETS